MNNTLFYLVILLANIIQGITGFAGTILAMPFAIRLVGLQTAVPVLNLLGMLSGIYVYAGNRQYAKTEEWKKILCIMGPFLLIGIALRSLLASQSVLLCRIFGIVVLLIAVEGLYRALRKEEGKRKLSLLPELFLAGSGLLHGLFVSGGPLLIAYLSDRIRDKASFRATISGIWILLNGFVFLTQLFTHVWTLDLLKTTLWSLPFFLVGMAAGSRLQRHMSQHVFMLLTYLLLIIAGFSLLMK